MVPVREQGGTEAGRAAASFNAVLPWFLGALAKPKSLLRDANPAFQHRQ